MDILLLFSLIRATVKMAVPLVAASVGEIFSERAGVVNIGLEGMILTGALCGMLGAHFTGSPWIGLMTGLWAGLLMAGGFTVVAVHFGADQVVTGAAVNLLALGLTGVFYRRIFGVTGTALTVPGFEPVDLPFFSSIPVVGELISGYPAPVYLVFLLVPLASYLLFYTSVGLSIRAVGEYPKAADTAGIPVARVRHLCVLVSGALAGVAGGYLSLAHANTFVEGMSAGRGFIALAIVIFGRWNPVGALIAALLFGLANAVQFQFQAIGAAVPYQFFLMLPYVLTLCVLVGFAGRTRPPAALAQAYERR
ncbi:MAG: ABC transporter permease [candidate division Zixibacteria bacterium]|nr:ABC transporter permease [candidate division Zixibacteria bacterium]